MFSILLSTIGIATYQHYCKDELKSVSFFIDLIVPCCPPKFQKQNKQKKQVSCCSSKKVCKLGAKKIKSCCANKLSETKKITPSSSKYKTVFKKKKCCEDKSILSQDDIENHIDNTDTEISTPPSFLPKLVTNLGFVQHSSNAWTSKTAYQFIYFHSPPDIPLYIMHQAFLC
jgi:hypothetical protein